MELINKFNNIKAIVLDIDGVMTDGTFGYGNDDEIKFFSTQDGVAIISAKKLGYIVGAISGRSCSANYRRAKELQFDFLYEEISTKIDAFEKILTNFNLNSNECLYMGDDLQDIAVIMKAGVGVMPANAPKYIHCYADYVTTKNGGDGAIREIVDLLIEKTGQRNKIFDFYGINFAKNDE
jgi:3-deoxy-D-manno-octulosonate 8-phosphate phosphatase (KDO 8-P phosphatase)